MTNSADAQLVRPRAPHLWHAALAGQIAMLLGIGLSRFGYSPLIPPLIEAGWFTPAEAAYLGAANLGGYLLGAAGTRWLARRASAAVLIRTALLLCTASFIACAFPLGFGWYCAWRLASGVTGAVLMVIAPPAILAFTPRHRRGRVGGIIFTGVGLGITLSGTLVPWLVHFGLRETWLGFGAASAVLTAVAWRGFPAPPAPGASLSPSPAASAAPPPPGPRAVPLAVPLAASVAGPRTPEGAPVPGAERAVPTPAILLLILAYGCVGAGFVPHTVFWVDYIARGLGSGLGAGGGYWVLFGVGAACGPLVTGLLAERIGFARSLRYSLLAKGAAIAVPLFSAQPWALALSSAGVGALAVGVTSLASGRVSEMVAAEHQRLIWGWMTIAYAIGYAGTAYLLSYVFARTSLYAPLFAAGAAILLLAAVLEFAGARREKHAPGEAEA